MITVANRIFVNPERADAFEERFRRRPRRVDTQPGFVSDHVLRPTKEGEPYVVLSFWESREAFEAWRTSPGFRDGHKGGRTLPEDTVLRNVVEIHEVFTASKGAGEG
ncbi:antibiotic biosynthesis monooxygenase family protein [Deinococcus wulumuqiensis]|uniref:Antibiotic biosynthesis monooxygenase n=1 Tax=Deinococcus wulumuqiensis TaxID=980427 RepID=A0A345IJD2_9DEIO|nr:antibiotic biosynthesis monooxygenase [Deinococcus wulumuqiensis]AXG99804.1 antibiotic biosynthesis monooxygenase [Deinococcus wulumuqiensis]